MTVETYTLDLSIAELAWICGSLGIRKALLLNDRSSVPALNEEGILKGENLLLQKGLIAATSLRKSLMAQLAAFPSAYLPRSDDHASPASPFVDTYTDVFTPLRLVRAPLASAILPLL